MALQRKQAGDSMSGTREPPPYPGYHKLWHQSASYSTSNSGSETSTDISTSSLENLSTSARQEPQGEETADLAPGLLDACAVSASSSSSLSSVDDVDAKSGGMWQCEATSNDSRVASVTAGQQTSHSQQQNPTQLSTSLAQPPPSNVAVDCRPVVSAGAANSLIRQLLQNSPQYSHLLSDLEPAYAGGSGGSVGGLEVKPAGSSPKSALRGGAGRLDGRSLPDTPPTVTSSSSRTGVSTYGGSQTAAAINRRLVNRYVNVDGDSGRSATQQRASYRDRQRPSTAPSSDHPPPPPPPPTAAALPPVTRVQTVADPVERRRSFEVVDRVTGATLPRPSAASKTADPLRKQSTTTKPTGLAQQNHHHQPHERQQQLQTASPQHLQSCGSSQQHHQQQRATGIPQSHQQEQQTAPPTTTTTTTSSSSSLCVEQQCAPGDNQRSSPQTVCAHAAIATRATQMVERLSEENRSLRQELKDYYKKVSKLEKVERNVQKVSDAYESLAKHSQKRENLEKLMRLKLDSEISRLNEANQQVQDHLEQSLLQLQKRQGYSSTDSELSKELHRKDALIARLIAENRELTTKKRRMETDASSQRSVIEESRTRITMLETILAKEALARRRLDRQHSSSSDPQLAVSRVPSSSDAGGEAVESPDVAGSNVDDDVQQLFKYQQCDTDDGISSDSESPTSVHSLIRQMQEKERHILRLETELARWEQKFLEEAVFRQLAVDAISIPKDAKIAALVQNSADTEKLLADTRLEKFAYLKELHNANERCAHLEAKVKTMQADLAERDSLIRVLQHHSSLSRASSISSLLAASSQCASPRLSPQQQHRSPVSLVLHAAAAGGSKPSSCSSSRQSSQLSAGSLSLNKNTKLGGTVVTSGHAVLANGIAQDSQSGHQMSAMEPVTFSSEAGQVQQCFWQV